MKGINVPYIARLKGCQEGTGLEGGPSEVKGLKGAREVQGWKGVPVR